MPTQTKETQNQITPEIALQLLKDGNHRFTHNNKRNRDLLGQVKQTATGQYPFASVVGCIDSRVPNETIFDQGIGSIFSARVAGNIINEDILGSLEFACQVAGTKLIVVLGHTSCGAVKGACDDVKLGNLTHLLAKIKPSVAATSSEDVADRSSKNSAFVNAVAETNVNLAVEQIRAQSEVLKALEDEGKIAIVGAMYDVANGQVEFYKA